MTRFASIMGVATVATLVLLSGCETPMKTDYTKQLDGTWVITGLMITAPNQAQPGQTIQIPTDVKVAIVDGSGVNTGSFTLTVTQTVVVPPDPTPQMVENVGSGMVKAESASVLKVTLTTIMGPGVQPEVKALEGVEQTLGYDLMDDSLKISGGVLAALGVTSSATDELMLTKQMASGS